MIHPHFYIRTDDPSFKQHYIKVVYEQVVMVYYDGACCHIHLVNEQKIKMFCSLSDCYIKYFKLVEEFIRASADYIININHIIGVGKVKNGYMDVHLTNANKATLRSSHLYAQRILSYDRKKYTIQGTPRLSTDSLRKDEIILECTNPLSARKTIKEELGEKVTIAYIRSRLKTLTSYG
jgi:hypothetical protein